MKISLLDFPTSARMLNLSSGPVCLPLPLHCGFGSTQAQCYLSMKSVLRVLTAEPGGVLWLLYVSSATLLSREEIILMFLCAFSTFQRTNWIESHTLSVSPLGGLRCIRQFRNLSWSLLFQKHCCPLPGTQLPSRLLLSPLPLWCLNPLVLGFCVLRPPCFGGVGSPGARLAQEGHFVRSGWEDVFYSGRAYKSVVNHSHSEFLPASSSSNPSIQFS